MGEDRLKKDEKVNASDEYVKARDAAASIHADEHRRARNELTEAKALIAQMAEALKQYADKARWSARKIPLGNGQSASAPGLFFGPNIAIEALAAHKNWSAK